MTEVLAALAISAATRLVAAMVDDGWQETKARVARWFARGDPEEQSRQETRLERAREEVIEGAGKDADQVQKRQAAAWQTRFEDILEDKPEAAGELRELMESLGQPRTAGAAGVVQLNAQASDQAQQAVQGQGVQTNTFTTPNRGE